MFMSRVKFSPRLIQIRVANTAIADGLHAVRDELARLQTEIDENRTKLPLESIPQAALVSSLAERANLSSSHMSTLQYQATSASSSVSLELKRLAGSLSQLHALLSSMKDRRDLRATSFEPITELIAHLSASLSKLEKTAAAANTGYFWPWACAGAAIVAAALLTLFKATPAAVFLFGDDSTLHVPAIVLLASFLIAATTAETVRQFYKIYVPKSNSAAKPAVPFAFWVRACSTPFGMVLGITSMAQCHILARAASGDPDFFGVVGFLLTLVCLIVFVINLLMYWGPLRGR